MMAKTNFAPMTPARRGNELLAAIETQLEAVPSALPVNAQSQASASTARSMEAETQSPRPEISKPAPFVLRLSPDVFRQIDSRAQVEGVTMTVVIARALVQAGINVPDDDLKDRRKRRYRG